MIFHLEFLAEDEMELAAAVLLAAKHRVETIGPIDTHQPDHREEYPHADSRRAFEVKWIEVFDIMPSISRLKERKRIDLSGSLKHDGLPQLQREPCIGIARGVKVGREAVALVTAQRDGLGRIAARIA